MTREKFDLSPVYDRITEEAGVFKYQQLADAIRVHAEPSGRALELCVGTGSLALRMAEHHKIWGLDMDDNMLRQARYKLSAAGHDAVFVSGAADNFDLDTTFDLIYEYSGHLLLNRPNAQQWFVNGVDRGGLRSTLRAVERHLAPDGAFVVGIESWGAPGTTESWPLPDGSVYRRWIIEENDRYGSRHHTFFDAPTGALHQEIQLRRPKLSSAVMEEELDAADLAVSATEAELLVCRRK